MDVIEAVEQRRSIRRFKPTPVPDDLVERVLRAATLAPSGKNSQPWRFVVVKEDKRPEMINLMRQGMARCQARGETPGSSEWTTMVMEHAPVTVFVFNPDGLHPWLAHSIDQNFSELVDTQSVGAAIQNMLLAALEVGLGSLWICDIFYAYEELSQWLGQPGQMIAAVSLGYPDEQPAARPRKTVQEVTRWL